MMYKNRLKIVLLPLVAAVALAAGIYIGTYSSQSSSRKAMEYIKQMAGGGMGHGTKLEAMLSLIDSRYVDPINLDTITEGLITPLLERLDPHSSYVPSDQAREANEQIEGEFDGIGVVFNMATDTVIIQSVISAGPSEKVGILPGDRIITVGDSMIAGVKRNQLEVVKMLKGPGGTKVNLGIERRGSEKLVYFEVTRDKIPVKSVDAAFMIAPKVGYIKLLQFSKMSHKEFITAMLRLKEEGMEHLIFDLTGNGGGLLDQAILIANEFLPKDKLIVYTEGDKSPKMEQFSLGDGNFIGQDILLLIDEASASASEIVAGALQDNDIGTLIGRRSFGKGLVQQHIPLPDGSFVNITIARYHTPTGRCIQRSYADGIEQYNSDIMTRYASSEMVSIDSIKMVDSLRYTTPKGKVVYGGGGIIPDLFVPMDTTRYTPFLRAAIGSNSIFLYALKFVDSSREELSKITSMDELKEFMDTRENQIYQGYLSYLAKNHKDIYNKFPDKASSKGTITTLVKAYSARYSPMEDNGFYLYYSAIDNIVGRALEVASENSTKRD